MEPESSGAKYVDGYNLFLDEADNSIKYLDPNGTAPGQPVPIDVQSACELGCQDAADSCTKSKKFGAAQNVLEACLECCLAAQNDIWGARLCVKTAKAACDNYSPGPPPLCHLHRN
jgi:hypothetical protein